MARIPDPILQILTLVLLAVAWAPAQAAEDAAPAQPDKLWVYVGTYTGSGSKGIYLCHLDLDNRQAHPGRTCRGGDESVLPRIAPQPAVAVLRRRSVGARREVGRTRQQLRHPAQDREAPGPQPAVVAGRRTLPPGGRPDGQVRAGGQLRRRQRGVAGSLPTTVDWATRPRSCSTKVPARTGNASRDPTPMASRSIRPGAACSCPISDWTKS